MPRKVDTDTLGFLVTDISRLIRADLDRRIAEAGIGLTPGEGRTLIHAARAGIVRQNVLAERMGVEAMTLSSFLDRLEARGLVARRPDPSDRRAKLVDITEEADTVIGQIQVVAAAVRAEAARSIDPVEWEQFLSILKIVRSNLTESRQEALHTPESTAA
jgi:MarR family transcriptional regulator, transcriptional regulator for hemolysin